MSLLDKYDAVITLYSVLFCLGELLELIVSTAGGKCSFQIKILSVPKDMDHLIKSGDEFHMLPEYVILW